MNKTRSFLIMNPYGIGDVLFSTPVISSLRAYDSDCRVFYLCNQRTYDIVKDIPGLTGFFIYDRDDFVRVKSVSFVQWTKKWWNFIQSIRREKIQIALDFSLNTGIGAIPFLAGIPRRVGLNYRRRGRFLTDSVAITGFEGRHAAEHYLMALKPLGIPVVHNGLMIGINDAAKVRADRFLEERAVSATDRVIGIAPCGGQAFGPEANIKRWPEEYFADLINVFAQRFPSKILLFAGPGEQKEIDRIMAMVKDPSACFSLTQASLSECAALVDRCELFIGNDTGPLRFADALKKKIIAFFGPVDEKVYGLFPFDAQRHRYMFSDVPCRPCYQKFRIRQCAMDRACLKNISVDQVVNAVEELIGK